MGVSEIGGSMNSYVLDNKNAVGYPALDWARLAAAFLVVAIHTSPLESVDGTADFVLTRVVARLAVPFFFMASGFFLALNKKRGALGGFLSKTGLMYLGCILLYLPLNAYMGDFTGPGFAYRLARDIFWNGTVYHLWYFPAVMLGGCIAWACYKYLRPAWGLVLCGALYLVGLGGDSWYGLATQIPGMQDFYGLLFEMFDYTRNGLFFAPLFVLMGMQMAGNRLPRFGRAGAGVGLGLGFAAMAAEALLLRGFGLMHHDSMYLALPVCSLFLFGLLVGKCGRAHPRLRSMAGWVFVLHPWCIVGVRALAKMAGVQWLVVDTSYVFYGCVCLLSVGAALLLAHLPKPPWLRAQGGQKQQNSENRAWVEVDGDALADNLDALQRLLPPKAQMMAVVKDDAYGHGAGWVAKRLYKAGVHAFAVATMEEGIALRRYGIKGVILVLGYTHPAKTAQLWFWRLTQTAVDAEHAHRLSATGWPVRVHLKADTGMHRLGIPAEDIETFLRVYALPNLRFEGIYTHLARADSQAEADKRFTQEQVEAWYGLLRQLAAAGVSVRKTHFQSSYGLVNMPGLPCDYVRCGLALYGVPERPGGVDDMKLHLRPVLALRARVASVRKVRGGAWVGYGDACQCEKSARIATVTVGYGDGIPRNVTGAAVLVNGCRAPVVGRVCMDQLSVCVDGMPDVVAGDVVTVIGWDGNDHIGAEDWAGWGETISNEVLCRVGRRVVTISRNNKASDRSYSKEVYASPVGADV